MNIIHNYIILVSASKIFLLTSSIQILTPMEGRRLAGLSENYSSPSVSETDASTDRIDV